MATYRNPAPLPLPEAGEQTLPRGHLSAAPARLSWEKIALVFAACVFPVHIWTILNLLQEVPAWILRLSVSELVGVVAYVQAFALLESLLALAFLVVLALLLPAGWLARRFISLGSALAVLTSLWAAALQVNYEVLRLWNPLRFMPWLLLSLLSLAGIYLLIQRSRKVEALIEALVRRLAVLSYLYVAVDLAGLIFVLIRNL